MNELYQNFTVNPAAADGAREKLRTMDPQTGGNSISNALGGGWFSLKANFDDVLSVLTRNSKAAVKFSNIVDLTYC